MYKVKIIVVVTLMLMFLVSTSAMAKGPSSLKMGTGSETGNYFAMGNDILSYCKESMKPDTPFEILNSAGSTANLTGMQNKLYSAGFTQEDVLQYMAKREPRKVNMNRLKIIAGMHLEPIQLLIPKGYKPKRIGDAPAPKSWWQKAKNKVTGGDEGIKAAPIVTISLELLEGQEIASWGGSKISAEALSYFTGVNFEIKEIPEDQRANLVMPILLVGGIPYKPIEEYLATGKFNLVSIDYEKIRHQAPFYMSVHANYTIGGTTYSATTIGVRALLLGKSFRKEIRNENMISLAQCISDNLADLADDPDTNPNWNSVYELEQDGSQTNWSYFPVK